MLAFLFQAINIRLLPGGMQDAGPDVAGNVMTRDEILAGIQRLNRNVPKLPGRFAAEQLFQFFLGLSLAAAELAAGNVPPEVAEPGIRTKANYYTGLKGGL